MTPKDYERARLVAELQEENARLRDLLGLDSRSSDGHATAWAPTLFSATPELVPVDATATDEQKVALLRSLFGHRSDMYAIRWENQSTGKRGWSPATLGGRRHGRSRDYLPLTDDVFLAHLRGEITVGIYPLRNDDTCGLLACDFDGGSWALDALAYLDACHAHGVPAVLELSRSGN